MAAPSRQSSSIVARPAADSRLDWFDFPPPRAARPFPPHKHLLFLFVVGLWLFFGLFGRDPWKPGETLLSAAVLEVLASGLQPVSEYGGDSHPPLYLWLSSLTAYVTQGFLPVHEGGRLINVLLLAAGFFSLADAVRRNYGIRVAWLSVLLVVSCPGFLIRTHQLNYGVPAFFGVCLLLQGLSMMRNGETRALRGMPGILIAAAAVIFLSLTVGVVVAAIFLLATVYCLITGGRNWPPILLLGILTVPSVAAVPWLAEGYHPLQVLTEKWRGEASPTAALTDFLRVSAWALFPVLPLAVLCRWRERSSPFLRMVTGFALFAFVSVFVVGDNEEDFYLVLPPLAILAARAIQTAPNDVARILDFFASLVVGFVFVGGLWGVWLALDMGVPATVDNYLAESFPGYVYAGAGGLAVAVAAFFTMAWFILLSNFGRSNERAVVNWCCGVTVVWIVFNLLFLDYVDSGKSFRPVITALRPHLQGECLTPPADRHWRSQLYYFGVSLGGRECPYFLSLTDDGRAVWSGRRNGNSPMYHLSPRLAAD